ncbi:uncharacterized protein PGRI_004650 [Penicillium griseofulvum]|uniref:Uncharacterized protein n=1 Tax=Penicillium patulum TaxID=5078 RepID=A0A135LWV0_PENPA|nr:uncharacterized protein PGRI_004650 [Penicillium griseofulvum]KXG53415.1 hypothetical protein PGRI_004650 [Penicillium griseofulvum]
MSLNESAEASPNNSPSGIIETMVVSPPEVDKNCRENVDGRQEAKHHYNQHELEVADLPIDELQKPKNHRETDKIKAQKLLDDGQQDPRQHDNPDGPKVPKLSLDNETPQRSYNYQITKALKALADKVSVLWNTGLKSSSDAATRRSQW